MEIRENLKYRYLDVLIKKNISFAVYRIPGEQHIRFVLQKAAGNEKVDNILSLKNRKGFVIAPFHISDNNPLILISPDISLCGEDEVFSYLRQLKDESSDNPQVKYIDNSQANTFEHYQAVYSLFQEELSQGEIKKLVLSRTFETPVTEEFSAGLSFQNACTKYPDNFVFICHTPETGTWLGCSPEVLLSGGNSRWKTVALAGTKKVTSKEENISWDNKNYTEQKIVVEYMKQQLQDASISFNYNEPVTSYSGNIAHLKSEFTFNINDSEKITSLLSLLPPTPAVCGYPKQEAYDFIIRNEGYDRKYYSGFLGYLDTEDKTDLFVNLRCMQIFTDKLKLFAGGGILPSSDLFSEWKETEYKLQTILSIING